MKRNNFSGTNLVKFCNSLSVSLWFKIRTFFLINSLLLLGISISSQAQKVKKEKPQPPVFVGTNGKLNYTPDSLGNRIPNYSYCGYKSGNEAIPFVPAKIYVPLVSGDATDRIQAAIDYVSSLPLDKSGFRGAVLLEPGTYQVDGYLKISVSGVVLRGSGMQNNGTILLGAGTDRQTLIVVSGKNDKVTEPEIAVSDSYVPVNATQLKIAKEGAFKAGDKIIIHRPSTDQWINTLGTYHFGGGITSLGWKPGDEDIFWDREVVSCQGNTITLNAPLTTAIDKNYGGGFVSKYSWNGRISNVGIENIKLQSAYDASNPADEVHRWMAITMENVCDAWVRQVIFENFAGSAVAVWETSKCITVEDCKSLNPVSEIAGLRRNTFWTTGQQCLFQRLYSEHGIHDFAVGYKAPGPNAFVQCQTLLSYSFSGGIDRWASGTLFDIVNVDGNAISFKNLSQDLQGGGWNTANSMLWNCSAALAECFAPPTANNWSFGTWAQFSGNGYWAESNNSINPRSFYYAQLIERLGDNAKKRAFYMDINTEASSSPPVEVAMQLTRESVKVQMQLKEYIDLASERQPISCSTAGVKKLEYKPVVKNSTINNYSIENGWLTHNNTIITGSRLSSPWWNLNVRDRGLNVAVPAVTRFVPGRTGTGLTDDLSLLTDSMLLNHQSLFEQNYALWYDRRDDDHERVRRMDGDAWPPFYELPFARTGKGRSWDGLSMYDLTKYNTWYWNRLSTFTKLGAEKGIVLINHNYFQHNIIEAGAHWASNPWRSANNINNTGFPEPPPYAGDKRIFMAEQFYDTTNVVRKQLHKAFIRHNLENYANDQNVIQFLSFEFTGPYHFVKFWLETIRDWEKETGKKEIIGLSVTKDVQDSILSNPELAKIVDIIDVRYWAYRSDGTAFEPKGGQNLAPRQHKRLIKVGDRSFEQVYRAIREYRDKFPGKAVMYSEDKWDQLGWAEFMAGGSFANIPAIPDMQKAAVSTLPLDITGTNNVYALANTGKDYIFYVTPGKSFSLDLSKFNGNFQVKKYNTDNGSVLSTEKIKGGSTLSLKNDKSSTVVIWISKI
jgi:hypothetical protein